MSKGAPYGGVGEAIRYCGKVKIKCSFDDAANQYVCRLYMGGHAGTQYVGVAPASRLAVDSPQAFDNAARAAVSFALDDKQIDESECDYGDGGPTIRRKK